MSEPTPGGEKFLASPADLALKIGTTATDPSLLLALRRAGGRFEDAIGYPVARVVDEEVYLSGTGTDTLILPARQVHGVPVVEVDGIPVVYGTGFTVARNAGILRRKCGVWPDDLDNVRVVYTHGWDPIPWGIQDAILEQAETQYRAVVAYQTRTAGAESITYSALAAVGVTQRWTDAVETYKRWGET